VKFKELSNNANGLCLIKKVISVCKEYPELATKLLDKMVENSIELVQNSYGNLHVKNRVERWELCNSGGVTYI
jgi:hypothetical protein